MDGDVYGLRPQDGWIVVHDVTVVRQTSQFDCGIAVLTSLLRYWREDVRPGELRRALEARSAEPLRAGQLRSALQAWGFAAFLITGQPEDLARHLARGRPIVVGMLKPYAGGNQLAHYELVVGFHPEQGVVTMDPGAGWRRYPFDGFDREWAAAGRLMLLAVPDRSNRSITPG